MDFYKQDYSSEVNDRLSSLFESFDNYYDPYFMLVSDKETSIKVGGDCVQFIQSNLDEVYGADWFGLKPGLFLVCISCDREFIDQITNTLADSCEVSLIHISIFRHNCLGIPSETFQWAVQLLKETIEQAQ